jgi:hypothetical protein
MVCLWILKSRKKLIFWRDLGNLQRLTFPKSHSKQVYHDARKAHWGDIFPHESNTQPVIRSRGIRRLIDSKPGTSAEEAEAVMDILLDRERPTMSENSEDLPLEGITFDEPRYEVDTPRRPVSPASAKERIKFDRRKMVKRDRAAKNVREFSTFVRPGLDLGGM